MSENHARPGFMLWLDDCDLWLEVLDDNEVGTLMRCIVDYIHTGEEPGTGIPRNIRAFFRQAKGKLDRDAKRYEKKRLQTSEAGKKSAEKRKMGELNKNIEVNLTSKGTNVNERQRMSTDVNERQRTSTDVNERQPTATATVTSTASASAPAISLSKPLSQLLEMWHQHFPDVETTTREKQMFETIQKEGYAQKDVLDAMAMAAKRATDAPALYVLALLRDWEKNGKPSNTPLAQQKPDNMLRHHYTEEDYRRMVVDLDKEMLEEEGDGSSEGGSNATTPQS